jgi:steroid delta-isomerase-like uncharacterized protein
MKKLLALSSLFLFAVFICSSCQPLEERTYTDADIQKIKDNAAKLWNGGDVAIVDSLYSKDCVYHNADLGDLKGAEEIKGFVKWVYTAYPDFAATLDEPMKLKDKAVITYKVTGTNEGPLYENIPPTGKKMSFTGISITKIEKGMITEEWNSYNQLAIYKQLGFKLVPEEVKEKKK